MKFCYLLISISILIVSKGYAQSGPYKWHRMDTSGLRWTQLDGHFDGIHGDYNERDSLYAYYTAGDTVINAKQYTRLYRFYKSYIGYDYWNWTLVSCTQTNVLTNKLVGWLREDSTQKVYFLNAPPRSFLHYWNGMQYDSFSITHETLLYDFNWKKGDTLPNQEYEIDTSRIITFADSSKRKVINVKYIGPGWNKDSFYIVEGMGFSTGLFGGYVYESSGTANAPYFQKLICFKDNNRIVISKNFAVDTILVTCESAYNTITQELPIPGNAVDIYPNPTSNYAIIKYNIPYSQNNTIEIYNTLGEKVYQETLPQRSNMKKVNIETLPAGIYLARIGNSPTTVSKKFIKQ